MVGCLDTSLSSHDALRMCYVDTLDWKVQHRSYSAAGCLLHSLRVLFGKVCDVWPFMGLTSLSPGSETPSPLSASSETSPSRFFSSKVLRLYTITLGFGA